MTADLAQKALEVLEAFADMAANGQAIMITVANGDQQITIVEDWGFGTATLIDHSGAHTHVGGDWENTREANLALFVQGMHQQLVQGGGLSWAPPPAATTPEEGEP